MRAAFHITLFLIVVAASAFVGALAWDRGIHAPDAISGLAADACEPGVDLGAPIGGGTAPASAAVHASEPAGFFGFFTGGGSYMPRVHCMVNEAGQTDWPWVWILIGLHAVVIMGYTKIFIFWRACYLSEEARDRNKKLMDLAWMFLWCAVCGYAASIMMFVWPAYRLVAVLLVPLAFITWKFCVNLEDMRVSLSAKRLERELHESIRARNEELEAEVVARTEELEAARDAERAASEAKSAFIATVSHEIRTPLNAIMGYSALMADGSLGQADRDEYAGVVRRNGQHLATVINDVLDQSKIESKNLAIDPTPCSPALIVNDVAMMMAPAAAEKGIGFETTTDTGVPSEVLGDQTRIKQVLLNLVSNAVKFTERGSVHVRVSAAVEGESCVLRMRVRDTGIGMTAEQTSRVFDAFQQAEPGTTRRFGGTGLGLAISRSLCELMGGTLGVQSAEGEGSEFTAEVVTGRVDGAVWMERLTVAARTPEQPATPPDSLRGRVLVVDDSIDNRRLFVMAIRKAGLEVAEANDGIEAIEAVDAAVAEGRPFGLILMDMDMPRCDGETAMRRIRATHAGQTIVVLTAHATHGLRESLIAKGFDDYASKPIHRAELVAICERWLVRGRDAA